MSTNKGQMEELVDAWFTLSEEMGKQWSEMTGTKDKGVKDAFRTWTDLSTEMGRGMADLMGGSSGAYTGVRRTWSEWSDRVAEQLSGARASSPDMSDLRDLQETWARNSRRMSELLTEQMAKSMSNQMEGMAKASETAGRTYGPLTGKETQEMTELTTTMARYWADNYAKVMQSTQSILAEDADVTTKARKVNDAWFGFTSDMMKEVMRTAAFSRLMGSVRDTDLDIQKQTRAFIEDGLRSMGVPSRSDMEEVQRSLKDIQMELRSLGQRVEGRAEPKRTSRKVSAKSGKGPKGKGPKGKGPKGKGAKR